MNKIALLKCPYTIRDYYDGAASLHISQIKAILNKNNIVDYYDYHSDSYVTFSKLMMGFIKKLKNKEKFKELLPSEIFNLLQRMIMEKQFDNSMSCVREFGLLGDDTIDKLYDALKITLSEFVNKISKDTNEIIVFVSPTIFFHLFIIQLISKSFPNAKITIMDDYVFEPATPYFKYIVTGKGILNEDYQEYYSFDPYNLIIKDFIIKNVSDLIIGEGYDILMNRDNESINKTKFKIVESNRMNLDLLPFPDYTGLDEIYESVEFEFTRGCLYKCIFCERTRLLENRIFKHSKKYIIDALGELKKYKFKYLTILDCALNLDEDYAISILDEIKKHDLQLSYQCNLRGKKPNIKLIKLLKETGCKEISFGIESVDQNVLNDMNKSQNIKIVDDLIKEISNSDIKLMLFIILGFPTEKYESVKKTVEYLKVLTKRYNIDVFEVEIYNPGIIQALNPLNYKDYEIIYDNFEKLSDIYESSISYFSPGFFGRLVFGNGMNKKELNQALDLYYKIRQKKLAPVETFGWKYFIESEE